MWRLCKALKIKKLIIGSLGLQAKTGLLLVLLILTVTGLGQWSYYQTAAEHLRSSDLLHAEMICASLAYSAQRDLVTGRAVDLQLICNEYIHRKGVRYVSLLDVSGHVVAATSQRGSGADLAPLARMGLDDDIARQESDKTVIVAKPVRVNNLAGKTNQLVGAVRVVLDVSETTATLGQLRYKMLLVTGVIGLGALVLSMAAFWKMVLWPIERVVRATRELAGGNLSAQCELSRSDELGELAFRLDAMAKEVKRKREELVDAKELLEIKVARRTRELKLSNRRLRDAMSEKEDFLRAVSHDLNAPLRNISGMANVSLRKWKDDLPEDVVLRLTRIQANVDAQAALLDELLELSRVREQPQIRQVVDMGRLLGNIAGEFEHDLEQGGITLTVQDDMPVLYLDEKRVGQIFRNLIDNAIKYMHRRVAGRIELTYRKGDAMHIFCVADNGPGIARQEHRRVFNVFNRGQHSDKCKVQGKGVGLALVKNIVSSYDGMAYVKSRPGEGSKFFVALSEKSTSVPREKGSPFV